MKRVKLYVTFFLISGIISGQIDRIGTPLSWTIGQDFISHSLWQTLPSPDIDNLLFEDAIETDKSRPYRFAYAHDVDYRLGMVGHWTNLQNGDRIWVLGIDCPGAFAIGLTFSFLNLPRGSKIYIYSEDHLDYIGPITSKDNRIEQMGTPPVRGTRIILEYYEPHASRGLGDFQIQHVTQSYRDLKNTATFNNSQCMELVEPELLSTELNSAASSVMMMLVDKGQRIATATLLNNTSNDATPYAMTSANAIIGDPSSWIFLLNIKGGACYFNNSGCNISALCGASVMETDPTNGVTLIRLRNSPKHSWNAYYSGWRLSVVSVSSDYTCIQHALGLPQSIATYDGHFVSSTMNGVSTKALDSAENGATFAGSIGSPLFDHDMNVIGMFVGGNSNCNAQGQDHFVYLSSSWNKFRNYLDPFVVAADRLEGLHPKIIPSTEQERKFNVFFFPNPAKEWIYIQNESDNAINEVCITDASGRLVLKIRPTVPTIDVSDLPEGIYTISFVSGNDAVTHSLLIR